MNQLVRIEPQTNVEAYRASTDAAEICRGIVIRTAKPIQGRKYVCVEGWQAIAIAHGCTASARGVERIEGGYRAIGEIRRMSDGCVIAEAEGFVGEDEPTWFGGGPKRLPKRSDYAIRAMAQTRAISRACRSAFAHVVVMMDADLSTTPAEEVPDGGFNDAPEPRPQAERQPARNDQQQSRPQQRQQAQVAEPEEGWAKWARALMDTAGMAPDVAALEKLIRDNLPLITASERVDRVMYRDLDKAFSDRRDILTDSVPA